MTDHAGSPLKEIIERIRTTRSLTLDATILGEKQFDLLKRIFPHQKDFVLSNCENLAPTNLSLTFTGEFAELFPWQKVPVEVCFFDQKTERQVLIRISILEVDLVYPFLSQYSVDPGECRSRLEVAPTTGLGDYIRDITFDRTPSYLIFSTFHYHTADGQAHFPQTFVGLEELPLTQVGRGLNFAADIRVANHVDLDVILKSRLRPTALKVSPPPYWCLIRSDEGISFEQRPVFKLTRAMEMAELAAGKLRFCPNGVSIGVELAQPRGEHTASQVFLEGTATVSSTPLQVTAAFDYYFSELSLSFTEFPSLIEFLEQVGLEGKFLPWPLSEMPDIKLSNLRFVVDLDRQSLSAISFNLVAGEISLIKDLITLKPRMGMQIYHPLNTRSRLIEGRLEGQWTLEDVKFTTELTYPGLHFYAGMEKGQEVHLEKIAQRLLPGIALPALKLKTMAVQGGVLEKTFSVEIRAIISDEDDKKWVIPGSRLNQEEIRLWMDYANQQVARCIVECSFQLAGVGIGLSAQYHAGQDGLQFKGRTDAPHSISIREVIGDAAKLFGIPKTVPSAIEKFTIKALDVSFNTHSKDFTFICDGKIEDMGVEGTVTLDLKHRPDGSFGTHFSGQITLGDGLQFALIFDTTGKDTQALATYHNPEGQPQSIQALIMPVSADLAATLPPSLAFTLHDALLGYHHSGAGSKWLFGVDIEGGLNLSDVKLLDFPLVSQFALPPEQTLKLAVQVVGANKKFEQDEVAALNALSPGAMKLPDGEIEGLTLAASLRLGQESKQLSLPIGLKKSGATSDPGKNPLEDSPASSAPADATAARPHSTAQAVSDDGMQWVMIQKSFGPVHFERVGIAYHDDVITGQLDAALSAGGLTIALDGLSVTSPLSRFDPTFSLRGLGIDYRNGPLEIGGSFLKQTMQEGEDTYTSFAGLAVLRTRQLSLSAIGSYALKDGHPSLFIYAVLDYPLGGPSFFFVTGLAAGFGYNRSLNIPTIEQVEAFPLIQISSSGQNGSTVESLPAGQKEQQELLVNRLSALEDYIPRSVGEHFLAIGLRFNSFKKIDSFALLTVKFGKALEFDLLGISTLSVPKVAEAQLALKATFNPESGFLGVRAQLTPTSYILSHACHLTGGFAFYSWFKDQRSAEKTTIKGGDFVLTLGGYHPDYTPPAHYPRVPRLGFNWQVDEYLQVKGDAYYAMTPHALMAGAHLEATWHKDQLKAWFTASADFLISWEPYHYDARLYVDLGASYTFDLFGSHTITADLGADLHLWGPEFSGEARIHWLFISFTVAFGEGAPTGLTPIKWEQFKKAFLPDDHQICGIAVQQGLIRQIKDGDDERWIMNPKEFVLVTNSAIPLTEAKEVLVIQGKSTSNPIAFTLKTDLAVRPVAVEKMQSMHQITITKEGEKGVESVPFAYTPVLKAVPAALWGAPQFTDQAKKDFLKPPDIHDDKVLIEEALAGFEIRPLNPTEQPGATEPFEPRLYETELIPDAFEWEDWTLTNGDLEGKDAREAATGYKDLKKRDLVFEALGFTNTGTGFLTALP
jgi:hypothetical protein